MIGGIFEDVEDDWEPEFEPNSWELGFDEYLQTTCGLTLEKLICLLDAFCNPGEHPTPRQANRAKECRALIAAIAQKMGPLDEPNAETQAAIEKSREIVRKRRGAGEAEHE